MTRHRGAFTLIELLVVVSIISILSLIAMPNMTLAITRAKISRVRNDMRIVANGLELYMVDHNEYPSDLRVARVVRFNSPINDIFARSKGEFHYETPESPWGVASLDKDGETSLATEMDYRWMLGSVGPDQDWYNLVPFKRTVVSEEEEDVSYCATAPYRDYDATNGTLSTGNVFRTSRNLEVLDPPAKFYEDIYMSGTE